jgi:hypothetical protein
VAQKTSPPSLALVVVIAGLGLVAYLAIAGTWKNDFDYTYVALAVLGLVGLVVRNAVDGGSDDDDPS